MITACELESPAIRHGFFTRTGGHSNGLYASLNCGLGSDDRRDRVLINRERVADRLGVNADGLITAYQVHSAEAVAVEGPFKGTPPNADALVTATSGLAIGVLTADCAPILFADTEAGVIGAAHSGWKGAITGIAQSTIDTMVSLGARADRITAVIGPTISRHAYEVGPEFIDRLIALDAGNSRWFTPSHCDDHAYFDLPGYIVSRVEASGVKTIRDLGICTYQDEGRFFSYRRTTHRGEPDYGRQISAITIVRT